MDPFQQIIDAALLKYPEIPEEESFDLDSYLAKYCNGAYKDSVYKQLARSYDCSGLVFNTLESL